MKAETDWLSAACRKIAQEDAEALERAIQRDEQAKQLADAMFLHDQKRLLSRLGKAYRLRSLRRLPVYGAAAAAVVLLAVTLHGSLAGRGRDTRVVGSPPSFLPGGIQTTASPFSATLAPLLPFVPSLTTTPTATPTAVVTTVLPATPSPTATATPPVPLSPPEMPEPTVSSVPSSTAANVHQYIPADWRGLHFLMDTTPFGTPVLSDLSENGMVYAQTAQFNDFSLTEYAAAVTIATAGSPAYVELNAGRLALWWQDDGEVCLCWDADGRTLLLRAKELKFLLSLAYDVVLTTDET